LTFNHSPGFSLRGCSTEAEGLTGMAGETDDPEDAAARLEAALERIAQHAASRPAGNAASATAAPGDDPTVNESGDHSGDLPAGGDGPTPPVDEIAARLDGLIDRLRAALTASSGGRPG
jgi:hypothetical protein